MHINYARGNMTVCSPKTYRLDALRAFQTTCLTARDTASDIVWRRVIEILEARCEEKERTDRAVQRA